MPKTYSLRVRFIAALTVSTLFFSASIVYPDIPGTVLTDHHSNLTRTKSAVQTGFVDAELRRLIGLPEVYLPDSSEYGRLARVVDLSEEIRNVSHRSELRAGEHSEFQSARKYTILKVVSSALIISAFAIGQYWIGLPGEKIYPKLSIAANLGVFTFFWVVTDFLGQWIAGRGVRIKQILWSFPMGLLCAWVTARGYDWINYFLPKNADLSPWRVFELASFTAFMFSRIFVPKNISLRFFIGMTAIFAVLTAADVSLKHIAIMGPRVFATFLIVYIRQTLYAWTVKRVLSETERSAEDLTEAKLAKEKKDESFWMTRFFSLVKNYLIMALPPGVAVAAEGIATQYFQIFYTWSQNKKGFWFSREEDRKNIPFLVWFFVAAPARAIFHKKGQPVSAKNAPRSELRMDKKFEVLEPSQPQRELAKEIAQTIFSTFFDYYSQYRVIISRAKTRFERREWDLTQQDNQDRLELYHRTVSFLENELNEKMGSHSRKETFWDLIQPHFESLLHDQGRVIFYLAFLNTVKRRFIPAQEKDVARFLTMDQGSEQSVDGSPPIFKSYKRKTSTLEVAESILRDRNFTVPYEDFKRDAQAIANVINEQLHLHEGELEGAIESIDIIDSHFVRFAKDYIIGRIRINSNIIPLAIALVNKETGIAIERVTRMGRETPRVLTDTSDVSRLFGYTHSSFQIDSDNHYGIIHFLSSLLPRKNPTQLYRALGHYNLAKSRQLAELFRLIRGGKKFEFAHSKEGKAMLVFRLPNSKILIKVMRDKFLAPKEVTHDEVVKRYFFMQHADLAGYAIHPFHLVNVRFPKSAFEPDVLEVLLDQARERIIDEGDTVVLKQLYTQSQVIPLDAFIREWIDKDPDMVRRMILDYARANRKLAEANIFSNDLPLWNYGVIAFGTPNMRVVLYDLDEIALVTDMEFDTFQRHAPSRPSSGNEYDDYLYDIMDPSEYVAVGPNSVFPEQFTMFVPDHVAEGDNFRLDFTKRHGWFFSAADWAAIQERIRLERSGLVTNFPYNLIARKQGNQRRSELRKLPNHADAKEILSAQSAFSASQIGFAFTRRDAFEVLTTELLGALAKSGMKIAIINHWDDRNLALLARINKNLNDSQRIIPAGSLKHANKLLRKFGSKETRYVTTEQADLEHARPFFDVVAYLPKKELLGWIQNTVATLAEAMSHARDAYIKTVQSA